MYIKAIVKDRQGKLHMIRVENDCDILTPVSFREQMAYAFATNNLLLKFAKAFRKYANQNYALVEIHTDNAFLARELQKEGHYTIFNPCPEEEVQVKT
jgi:hypothetical protein